jgi:thioredoxin 1
MKELKYFTAKWCGPCRMFKPYVIKLIEDGANIKIIDIDESPEESDRYQIMSVPSLIFEEDGEIFAKVSGGLDPGKIMEMLN